MMWIPAGQLKSSGTAGPSNLAATRSFVTNTAPAVDIAEQVQGGMMFVFKDWSFRWQERKLHLYYGPRLKKVKKSSEDYERLEQDYGEDQISLA
ncbi:MAG: hypothetical protein K0S45_3866 [Nitrospira sp.]|jgi:hypothetical protein|nr:hypothetical protein [Nitrospira sp.]